MNRRRQRGFTLIELMVALVVSSLLVGMILAIFSRMSLAYRGQQQIASVQQVLAAARATIELDAKPAGLAMAQGFKFAGDPPAAPSPPVARSPVRVVNSSTGPDQIAFFYADTSTQAVVTEVGSWPATLGVDTTAGFAPGDLVVLSTADPAMANPVNAADARLVTYDACVLRIAVGGVLAGSPGSLMFETVPPWGRPDSSHCGTPVPNPPPPSPPPPAPPETRQPTMIYKFVARAYRIDTSTPARAAIGPLQGSATGGLLGAGEAWTDLAYGFTDLQTALQVYDGDGSDTADPDSDPTRDWYSDGMQDTLTASAMVLPASLLQMSISLVARTDRDVEGIATSQTPQLIDPVNPGNNTIGDHPAVALPPAPPWVPDPALQGARIYRSTTFQVDLRNLGIGR
jgi:prepilin-type N-terminal cleavage/methylation domain-containing protein